MKKVISLQQPYASAIFAKRILIEENLKNIETRSWNTSYRGEILIHSSLSKVKLNRELFDKYSKYFEPDNFDSLPFGKIIGSVNIIDSLSTDCTINAGGGGIYIERNGRSYQWEFSRIERDFGDYSKGRYIWLLSDPKKLVDPIPAKGQLGLWNFEISNEFLNFL